MPPRLQAAWVSRALHRLWVAGVGLVEWEFLVDPFPGVARGAPPTGGTIEYDRPAGLYSAAAGGDPALARPKPFLQGFALPFDPLRVDRAPRARVGAAQRPGSQAIVQVGGRRGGWRTLARLRASGSGVLNTLVRAARRGAAAPARAARWRARARQSRPARSSRP